MYYGLELTEMWFLPVGSALLYILIIGMVWGQAGWKTAMGIMFFSLLGVLIWALGLLLALH